MFLSRAANLLGSVWPFPNLCNAECVVVSFFKWLRLVQMARFHFITADRFTTRRLP